MFVPTHHTIHPNPKTSFNPVHKSPTVPQSSTIHPRSTVIGDVRMGNNAFVAPSAVVRADEGSPIYIGSNSNVQDGAVVHGLKNKPGEQYSVVIGNNVSIAHQALVHGPAYINDNTFIGFQTLVFKAVVGKNCVVEPGAKVMDCQVPDNRYVPAGMVVDSQEKANNLPVVTDDYVYKHLNEEVVHVNKELGQGYAQMQTSMHPAFRPMPQVTAPPPQVYSAVPPAYNYHLMPGYVAQ